MADMLHLCLKGKFDASHFYTGVHSPDANLHGHTWRVEVFYAASEVDSLGEFPQVAQLKRIFNQVLQELNYSCVNSSIQGPEGNPKSNPTAGNIARWLFERLSGYTNFPNPETVVVSDSEDYALSYSG